MNTLAAPMMDRSERLGVLWAGFVILVASVLGGGTTSYLVSDRWLEALVWPLAAYGLLRIARADMDPAAKLWLSAVLMLLLATAAAIVWPAIHAAMAATGLPAPVNRSAAVSYVLFGLAAAGFATFVAALSDQGRIRLLAFFLVGLLINLTVAGLQLSTLRQGQVFGGWYYPEGVGFFANQNHFSAFLYALLPMTAWLFIDRQRSPVLYWVLGLAMVVILFAAGSYAAMALVTALFALCYLVFWRDRYGRNLVPPWTGLLVLVLLVPLVAVLWAQGESEAAPGLRLQFWQNSWVAMRDLWPSGGGLGAFHLVYPRYESAEQDLRVFANYAHNDWLELLMEWGVWGALLMLGAVLLVLRHAVAGGTKTAAAIGLGALMFHSLVDYPLRTLAVALLAAFLFAVLVGRSDRPAPSVPMRSGQKPGTGTRTTTTTMTTTTRIMPGS